MQAALTMQLNHVCRMLAVAVFASAPAEALRLSQNCPCALPPLTTAHTLISYHYAQVEPHNVYTRMTIGGTLESKTQGSKAADGLVTVGGSYLPKFDRQWNFNKNPQPKTEPVSADFSTVFDWSDFESLARRIVPGQYENGQKGQPCDDFYVFVLTKGGTFNLQSFHTNEQCKQQAQGEDNGKTLVVFNTDEPITLEGKSGRQFGPSVLAPFSTVTLASNAGFLDGVLVANNSIMLGNQNQLHGDAYAGPLECRCASPTGIPTTSPTTSPTASPTGRPTASPTDSPTSSPTSSPTGNPTLSPTASPTDSPTDSPTSSPTSSPTASPTDSPTSSPTSSPTAGPTESPTSSPTSSPTGSPTENPTSSPTASPTDSPTDSPTSSPTSSPTAGPTENPTLSPTASPTGSPTSSPTDAPTLSPTSSPTASPTENPTSSPTASPTAGPTASPTESPTALPTPSPTSHSVTGTGDPHLENVRAERFDLRRTGTHTLLMLPRGAKDEAAVLQLLGEVTTPGDVCGGKLYITGLSVSGSWLGSLQQLRFSTGGEAFNTPEVVGLSVGSSGNISLDDFASLVPGTMLRVHRPAGPLEEVRALYQHVTVLSVGLRFGPGVIMRVDWVHQKEKVGFSNWLQLSATGLSQTSMEVGGLLGEDDHTVVESWPEECAARKLRTASNTQQRSRPVAPADVVASASLDAGVDGDAAW